jgi:acyl-CoA reductase-like NAD-dependent aldehyde dehydrogenase
MPPILTPSCYPNRYQARPGQPGGGGHSRPGAAPSGGVKDSGYRREGGRHGIVEFLTTKNVAIALA